MTHPPVWIAISEQMPRDNQRVLVCWNGLIDTILIGSYDRFFGWMAEGRRCPDPTHWMLLPDLPGTEP